MKTRLLFLLLFVSSYTFAQNWSQVGATQFSSNSVKNAEIAFDNAGTPFVVYEKSSNYGIYVEKYDGTNWVQVGGVISTEDYNNLTIKVNPTTNEPWVVLKAAAGGTSSNLDIYSFNGAAWVSQGQNVGGNLYSYGVQLQFNASGNPRIAGIASGGLPNKGGKFFTKTNTGWSDLLGLSDREARIDFYGYNEYVMADSDGFIRKLDVASSQTYTVFVSGSTTDYRKISGIKGTNFFATYKINGSSIKVGNGSNTIAQPIGADAVEQGNGILKFRESTTDNNYYLMFEETDNTIVFQKYGAASGIWVPLPSIGLSTTGNGSFVKMEMNPVDGNMYVLYKDGAKMSLKKFAVQPSLNLPRIYVDADATGNVNGSSWADAFTTIQGAIANVDTNTTEIWIAEGTYKPHASDRSASFMFGNLITFYGGFNGTETQISQRDLLNNATILSGDLNDDDTGVSWTANNRADNSYHVVKITSDNVILDGFTIQGGQADTLTGINGQGGGILKEQTNSINFTIRNCTIKNNVGFTSGGMFLSYTDGGNLTIENCRFENNLSRYGAGFYVTTSANKTLAVKVSNSLFTHNITSNRGTGTSRGYASSAFWIRADVNTATIDADIRNCTFSLNREEGTHTGVSQRSTIGLSRYTNTTFNAEISNCIFYGNTQTSGTALSIGSMITTIPGSTEVNNSIGEDSFSNLSLLTNTSNSNPLFTDAANNDFTLQSGSPAIDAGDNNLIPAGIVADLLQNDRIFNTTVDMGCYEYGSSPVAAVNELTTNLDFTLYPNPVNNTLNIALDTAISNVAIYNLQGQKVKESTTEQVNVATLSQGIYLIKIEDENGNTAMKKFIKK